MKTTLESVKNKIDTTESKEIRELAEKHLEGIESSYMLIGWGLGIQEEVESIIDESI